MNFYGLNLSDRDLWLLSALGVCLAWLVPHRLAIRRENQNRLLAASVVFRNTINTDISEVANPARLPDIYVYLAQKFPAHDAAVREFATYLSRRRRCRLLNDWAAYGNDINELRQRYNTISGHPEAESRRRLAVERLRKVVAHGL